MILEADNQDLVAGDEIGIFDGDLCVGAALLDAPISSNLLPMIASTDDPTTSEVDGFIPGHQISFRFWKSSEQKEYVVQNIQFLDPSSGNPINPLPFASQGSAVVVLKALGVQTQQISLSSGWNIMSFNVVPSDLNMLHVVDPFIQNNSLIKIQDEKGNAVEKIFGSWKNGIGNVAVTEGYYVKLNQSQTLQVEGSAVNFPVNVDLIKGWNILGYPYQNSTDPLSLLSALITDDQLIKVQDEKGNAIEKIFGNWQNSIGNSIEQSLQPITLSPEKIYSPMNLYVTFDEDIYLLPEMVVQIHNLDGISCQYTLENGVSTYNLIVSGDDPTTDEIDGFKENEVFQVKVYSPLGDQLFRVKYLDRDGNEVERVSFQSHETLVLKVEQIEAEEEILPDRVTLFANYPNPFNPETTIKFYLTKREQVELQVFNINGQLVKTIYRGTLSEGIHTFKWDGVSDQGNIVSSGVYLIVLRYSKGNLTQRMILMK